MISERNNLSTGNKNPKRASGPWTSRLRGSFLPVIRERGERYAEENRVLLQEVSHDRIAGKVRGIIHYEVELFVSNDSDKGNDIRTWCSCPFFRQGFPCKHLWAAIIEADRILQQGRTGRPSKSGDTHDGARRIDRNWRRFFRSEAFDSKDGVVTRRERTPGKFIPVYTLHVGERELLFSAVKRYVKKDGTLGRKKRISISYSSSGSVPVADRILMAVIEEIARQNGAYLYYGSTAGKYEDLLIHQDDLEVLLPLLADTGRCVVEFWKKGVIADPLIRGNPFDAGFRLKAQDKAREGRDPDSDDIMKLVPVFYVHQANSDSEGKGLLEIEQESMDCIFNTNPLMFVSNGRLYQVKDIPFSWIYELYPLEYIEVSKEEIPELLTAAESLPAVPELELPESLSPVCMDSVKPSPVLVVEFDHSMVTARFLLDYDGLEINWQDKRETILDPDRWMRILRHRSEEQRFLKILSEEGFMQQGKTFLRKRQNISKVFTSLEKQGFRLEAKNRKRIRPKNKTAFEIRSGVDWFDLEGHISFDDTIIPLRRAINEYLKGNSTIPLSDGTIGLLPTEWLEKQVAVFDIAMPVARADTETDAIRFPMSQAMLIDSLLEETEADEVSVDKEFTVLRDAMKDFRGIERVPVPDEFHGTLRPYQQDTLGWFAFLKKMNFGGILADDMGLGKTVQVLAWLSHYVKPGHAEEKGAQDIKTTLIVVPTSLVFNWKSEAHRFVPNMKVLVYSGANRQALLEKISEYHLVITTYGLLRRDIVELRNIKFEYAILDESQAIKNPASQTAKAARLLNAAHRLCLTGTPLENNVGELWSQMEFLNPGILGNRGIFEKKFLKPIDRDDEQALHALKTIVKPFILRRTKELVASELPEKMEQTVFCVMPPGQAEIYRNLRDHFRTSILSRVRQKGISSSKIKVLEALLRLRQAANHPALVGHKDAHSGKLDELIHLVDEAVAGGHKALIFSQFTKMLALIRKSLDTKGISYQYLDGRVPQKQREDRVSRFQEDDDIKLFLISLKAGGVGLNLTAADYVFIVDPWWNPAVELQAVDRTHRIGQDKRVFTYRFITTGTVEEKVLALQKQKQELVSSILSGSGDMLRNLSAQDLEVLFS